MSIGTKSVGTPLSRVDGRAKVTGQARYAFEQPAGNVAYAAAVTATVAAGEIDAIDPERAEEVLRGRESTAEAFAEAADAELEAAQPLRDNAFKVQLAHNVIVRTLSELTT